MSEQMKPAPGWQTENRKLNEIRDRAYDTDPIQDAEQIRDEVVHLAEAVMRIEKRLAALEEGQRRD